MNARSVIEFAVLGGVIPAVAAIAVFFAIGWSWPNEVSRRYQAGAAFAAAVFFGFVLLPSTKSLAPAQFWDWIPYLGLIGAFLAGLTRADGVQRGERWAGYYLFAFVSAFLLVPNWPELSPVRPVQVTTMAAGMVLAAALFIPLPGRLPGGTLPFWMMVAAGATSVLILSEVSEIFAPLAALPAGALAGCLVASRFTANPVDWRGLVLPYVVVTAGYAFLGAVYPTTPLWLLLLVPVSPLGLWLFASGPLSRLNGVWALAAQAVCVLTPILIVAAVLVSRSAVGEEW